MFFCLQNPRNRGFVQSLFDIVVFSKGGLRHESFFKLSTFMFDIHVTEKHNFEIVS